MSDLKYLDKNIPEKGRDLIESEPGCCKYNGWFYQTYNKMTHCCGPDGVQELGLCQSMKFYHTASQNGLNGKTDRSYNVNITMSNRIVPLLTIFTICQATSK